MANPQQGNRNLEKFHGRLEKYGIKNVPDYETFSNVMQDASKRRKLYDRLVNKGHTMPSFESFSKTLGFEDAPQSEKTSGSYTPYTTQFAQKMVDVNQGSGDNNVFVKGNAPLAPEYHQQMQNVQPVNNAQTQNAQQPQQTAAAPDSTVVAPTTTSQDTVQVDNTVPDSTVVTPAISQDTIQTNGVMPDSTMVAPTATPQDTIQVNNAAPTENPVQNTDLTQKPMDYMQLMAQKTAPIRDVMQQTQQTAAAPDSTVVTPAISQDTIQTNGVMPDSTMVAPTATPQDTIQVNNAAPTENPVQNTDLTQKPMDYMQLMAQKTAPIRDVMQQTQHAQQIAENEMVQQQLRREDYDNNSKLLEQESAKYESALSEYEKAAEEFNARYPEGWQPKTKAEYDNYRNDLEVIKTQGNLIEAKRKVLEGEVNRLNELGDAINKYEMERLNSPAIQAQTLKGNINDLINSVRTELEEVDNKRNLVSRRGMQPKGGIMSMASSMSESVSNDGKPNEEVSNRKILQISKNILSRTQRIIRASEAERKDEEVTAIWGKKASWLGTVAGNVADYMKGYWRGYVDKIMDGSVFDFGLSDMAETWMLYDAIKKNDAIEAIAKKKAEGKALSAEEKKVFAQGLSTSERALLDAAAMEVAATAMFKTGMGYTGGQIAVEMIPFALELAINPAAAIGTTAGSGVLRYAMKKFGKTALKQSRKTLKTAITLTRLGTDLAVGGPTMALTTGAGKTFADFNRRRTGQIEYGLDDYGNLVFAGHEEGMSTGKAAVTAIASQSLEYSTENMSEWGKAIKALGVTAKGSGKIADKIGRMFAYMDKTQVGRLIQDFKKYGLIGNPFEEYGEEVINNIGNGIIDYLAEGENKFTTDESGVFNLHDNIETFLSVTVPQVIQSVVGLAAYGISHQSINKGKYNERHAETIRENIGIFGPDQWQALRGVLDEAEGIEDLARVTMSLVEDPDYTPEQRAAIIKYSQSLVAKRTEDMAETKMTDHVFETDPDYVELGNRTDPENGTITTATTTNGEVVYVKSADEAGGTSVVYNPSTGETEQIPNNRIGSTEQPIDANEEAEKIAKARELATNMEVGSQLNIGGHVFEIVDFSPDTHMPIADIYGTEGDVTTREMTYDEVLAANQQQEEVANMTISEKLRKAVEEGDQQLYNQAWGEIDDMITAATSLKDLNSIAAELDKIFPDLGVYNPIEERREEIENERLAQISSASTKEELAQIEQTIGDDDTINNDFKKAIAKRYAELEDEAEQKSKKALDDVKALIDSTVDPAALDSIVLDGALSDNDRQIAQNLIEKKRRELAENAEKETPAADAVQPSTEAASAETAQQQPKAAETAVSDTEEPAKEAAREETPTQEVSQQTDGKESLVNKAGKKILDKWASAKKIVGNRVTNTFNKRKLKGYYVLVEAESLSPSHNPLDGFKKTEGFPEDKNGNTVNDRDYENDRNEQTGVVSLSTNYTGEALTNMPVIAKDSGIPYSGNKRTMAGQLAAINGTDSDYIESLKENLSVYGFDEEDLAQFTHPRVVFMLDESLPYDAETFALFNKRSEYAQGAVATMVKLGKIINQETFNRLMDSISGYETIGEVWADKNVVAEIISILQNSGLISEADFVLYVDNGELTESGKDLISGALVGKVLEGREDAVKALNDPDTKSLAASIITALPQIAINQRLGKNSILTYIADAIILAHDARKSGVSGNMPITTHLRQTEMQFEEEQVEPVHPAVIAIGTFIHSNKTSYLRDFLKKYNKHYLKNDENSISLFEDIPYEERLVGMLINAINELSKDIENDKKQTSYTRSMLESLKSVNASLQNKLNQLKNGTGKQQQQSRHNRESGGRVESSARDESEQVAANGSNGSVNDNGGVRGREEENAGGGAERIGAETVDRGKEESNREEQQGTDDTAATETASPAASTTKDGGNPSGKTTSSSEGKKKRQSLPKNATRDEAKAYFDSVYGKDSERAKRKLEIWELSNDAYKLRAVYDPEKEAERQIKLMKLCVEDGLDFIKDGFVKFADWAKAMVTDFGEKIKKYLKQTYMSMTAYVDDRTFEQMDSAQTVRGFDLDSIVIDEEEEAEENNNNNNDDNGREEVLRGSRVPNGTDTNRPSGNADNGGRGVQHGADHGGNGEVEMAGGRDRHIPQKHDNANGSDGNGRKGTDRDRQSDTGGRNADIEGTGSRDDVGRGTDILNGTESTETTDKTDRKEKAGFTKTNSLTETELNVERLIRSLDIPTYEAYLTAAKMQQAMEDDVRVLDAMLQPKNITIKPGETLSSFNERVKKAFKAGEILRKHHLDAANEMNLLNGTENANTIGLITNFLFDRFEQGGVPMWFETQESAQEAIEENEGAEFSRVTDKEAIKKLESEPTMKVYRAMQLIDGKLYPPMSAIMPDGTMREASELGAWEQADENPELADEKGYFKLDKGNKTSVPARYNPYFHTSLTALNDQFASAQDRPNLVTVEMEIPVSELTSGYKAVKAKDSVGKLEWKAGLVQSKLSGTRTVILSRWAKPVRIVPDGEVAASIKEMFGDKNIVMPSNVVTPSLRKELEKLGVSFVKTDNRGKIEEGKWKGMTYGRAFSEFSKEASPFRLSDGTVYGWASADGIHLTMEGIRPDTMIHEYGHLWLAAMKENNPALYESLMRLAKDSPLWKEVISDPAYKELTDDDAILSEVFARFSGTEGERKMVDTMREAIANGEDMKEKASIAGLYSRLAKKLDKAWGWTLKYLDQDPTEFESMAEAADMLLKDIISGSSPNGGGYKPNGRLKTPKNGNPFFNSVNEYSRGGNASQPSYIASDEYERRVATKTAMFEEAWVDYLNSVRILQEALISETGNEIHDYENVYQHMMHLSSVNRAEQDKVWASHIEPMIEAMNNVLATLIAQYRENGAGRKTSRVKAMDELEKYLIASHGLERNKVLARRDAKAKADSEFYMRIKEAEKLLRKAQADFAAGRVTADVVQAAQDNLNQIEAERQKREDDLYARNRQKDYSGFTETFGEQGQSYTNTELETIAKDFAALFEDKIDNKESIDNLWKTINAVNGYTLKKALDSGNISRDTYKRLTKQYSQYVPLRGWDDTTADEVYEYISEGDRSKPQNPNKTAKGRLSRAGDIIATIIAINSSAILTGNKNLAKQKLLNLVQNNKTSLTAVSNTWYVQLPDGTWEPSYPVDAAGEPLTDPDAIADWEEDMKKLREEGSARMGHEHLSLGMPVVRWQEKEHQVRVNRNGREYVVYINGAPNASQAINGLLNMDASKSDSLEKMSRPINRFMAKNFTSRNPLFVLRNFEKDVVSAATLSGIKFGLGYVGKLIANVTRLLPGLAFARKSTYKLGNTADVFERGTFGMYNLIRKYKEGRLDENDEVEKYFMEFMTHGGHTGYSNLYNVEESSKIVENRVKRANTRLSSEIVQNTLDAIGSWWDDINSSFEDITRFATFMTSRQNGRSILESVADAKDASVNFNKKGSGKYGNRLARDLFIFINPAIQGIARYAYQLINKDVSGKGVDKGLKRQRTARALAGFATLVSVGVMNTLAGYFTSLMRGDDGDDDDKIFGKKGLGNDYWKLSTFKRRNTINIACGDGYIPINLTAEEALPYSIGAILTEHALGYGHNDQIMPELVGQLSRISPFGSIEPLKWNTASDMGKEMFKNLLPSSALPFWEIYDNKNFMGSQIHGYGNTLKKNSPVWQQNLQQKIDDATGRRLGAYGNINNIEHVAKSYLGGLAELPMLIANCFEYAFTESPVNINETPMKVFWNSVQNEWNQKSALVGEFQYYKAKVDWVEEGLKAKELTKNAAQDVYVSKHLEENANYRYWKVFRKYEKQYNSRKQTDKTDLMKQIITEWRALDEAE